MARMIPGTGARDYDPASREGMLYQALSSLPDDFVVVHSMRLVTIATDVVVEREADFVVFHPELGIVCLEAKAGRVYYKEGDWYYGNDAAMPHGGPFNQASNAKHRLRDLFRERRMGDLLKRCRMHHAVWFPSIDAEALSGVSLPPEAERDLLLLKEDLADPEPALRRILSLEIGGVDTDLSEADARRIVEDVLCPSFDLVPNKRLRYDLQGYAFLQLLDSQKKVLDFLVDQRAAVINGVAGSGKTLLAVEHARRLAERGERVLLLCYNALLCDDLRSRCEGNRFIDVYTIAGLACRVCDSREPDFAALEDWLEARFAEEGFPYRHVVVDEGQDFAVTELNRLDILGTLDALTEQQGGTFYLFYDRNQLVQGAEIPRFILDADCKLTLPVNCRNTRNVARCAMAALDEEKRCRVRDSAVPGSNPVMIATTDPEEQAAFVDSCIGELRAAGIDDIVVLTCRTEQRSSLSAYVEGGKWKGAEVPFHTCRRFKGLEADAVILVDVCREEWVVDVGMPYQPASGLLFYTGATRARHELRIVCDLDEKSCGEVLGALGVEGRRKPFRLLAKKLNAELATAE